MIRLFCLVLLVAAFGCSSALPTDKSDGDLTVEGTVQYLDLEGGFYGIVTVDDERLLPDALPEAFRVDGLGVRVTGRFDDDRVTIQQWGRPFVVTGIERR